MQMAFQTNLADTAPTWVLYPLCFFDFFRVILVTNPRRPTRRGFAHCLKSKVAYFISSVSISDIQVQYVVISGVMVSISIRAVLKTTQFWR